MPDSRVFMIIGGLENTGGADLHQEIFMVQAAEIVLHAVRKKIIP